MLKRDELGFPSFWQLQVVGWIGFSSLMLLAVLPYHKTEELWNQAVCCALSFLGSCLLRPVCRSLVHRSISWLALESRAFGWSATLGVIATLVTELAKLHPASTNWGDRLEDWLQFSVIFFLWCTLYFSVKQWQQAAGERERLLRAESAAREARLSALRYQLNPHFLFNSLNAVSTLVLDGNAPAATRMLAQIGELLRTTLDSSAAPEMPLFQEFAFVEQYLAIEQTRLGDRLRVNIAISPDTVDAVIPAMLLQPLVENAIRHGVGSLIDGGTIGISSDLQDGRVRIAIRNSGPRAAGSSKINGRLPKGIGLANTKERLRTLYGDNHQFALCWLETGGCEVTIELPFQKTAQYPEEVVCVR